VRHELRLDVEPLPELVYRGEVRRVRRYVQAVHAELLREVKRAV
jgi:hypothetical protein